MSQEWFADWFDSPYYHILYQHRNDDEAQQFIDNLLRALAIPPNAKVADLACGKGRHARYIAQHAQLEVVGLDLSPQSIQYAQQFSHERLHFAVQDMRQVYKPHYFDYVFNFFTSFGYFDSPDDNLKTLRAIKHSLKPNGYVVIDFLNIVKVIANLVPANTQIIDNIRFDLTRQVKDNHIVKTIKITPPNEAPLYFEERVQAINLEDLVSYFRESGFAIYEIWGSYALRPFNENTSDRLIIVGRAT